MSAPHIKTYPWADLKGDKRECRAYCPKCGQSKMIDGYKNAFWRNANLNPMQTQCDRCREFFTIRMHDNGVEVMA